MNNLLKNSGAGEGGSAPLVRRQAKHKSQQNIRYLAQQLIVKRQFCTRVCTLVRFQAYPVKLQV